MITFVILQPVKTKGNNMGKILMIPVTFAITGIAFCCMASPFLVLGGSFLKGFIE
jgi:hypothetical protein